VYDISSGSHQGLMAAVSPGARARSVASSTRSANADSVNCGQPIAPVRGVGDILVDNAVHQHRQGPQLRRPAVQAGGLVISISVVLLGNIRKQRAERRDRGRTGGSP